MKKRHGMTIIELLFATSVALLMFAAFTTWFILAMRAGDYSNNLLVASDQARIGMTTITRELREAVAGEDGAYILETSLPNELTFYSDVDSDEESERVRYYLEGGTLMRGVIHPTGFPPVYVSENEVTEIVAIELQNDVDNPIFEYYGQGYRDQIDPLAEPVVESDVRLIHMDLIVDPNPDDQREALSLETDIQLRNIFETK